MSGKQGGITTEAPPGSEAAVDPTTLAAELQRLRNLLEGGDVEGARRLIKEMEVRWPDSERVRHYVRVLAPPRARMRSDIKIRPLEKERAWLRQHAHEHPGCWLAVLGSELIAADPDGSRVRAKAREITGEDRPLIYYQPDLPERA